MILPKSEQDRINDIVDGLRFIDDTCFNQVFDHNLKGTSVLINAALERDDIEIVKAKTQYAVPNIAGKSVVLDLHASDTKGRVYGVEAQQSDKGAIALRARYYAGMIDQITLKKGKEYKELPESHLIFLCEHDVLETGRSHCLIERGILKTERSFGDCQHITYVNAEVKDGSRVSDLMHDLFETDYRKMIIPELAEMMKNLKEGNGREKMCEIVEAYAREREAKGKLLEQTNIVTRMLQKGMSETVVADLTGIALSKVKEIALSLA